MEINEQDKITRVRKGECVFIRKDNQVGMTKQPTKRITQ
jgi:hypothetical protein